MRKYKKPKKSLTNLEIKKIRSKFYFVEIIDEYLKELEEKDSLTRQEKKVKRRFKQIKKTSIQYY